MGNFSVISSVLLQIWKNTPDQEHNLPDATQQKRQSQYEFTSDGRK